MFTNRLKFLSIVALWFVLSPAVAQQIEEIPLTSFNKIVVGPHIDVELIQGNEEKTMLKYSGVDRQDIHVDIDGNTLRLYLDGARMIPKDQQYNTKKPKKSKYADARVRAQVSYVTLKKLKVRGEDRVICNSSLTGDRFKLRLFGENDVVLTSVETDVFVASLFGENELQVDAGAVGKGKYKFFGDNEVDAIGLASDYSKAKSFGESEFRLNVDDLFRVSSFGESIFRFTGDAEVSRGFMFGENSIYQK